MGQRVGVDAPSLEMHKAGFNGALSSLIWWGLELGGL